jgi:hypothetical protein
MNNANLDQSLTDLNKIIKDLAQAANQPVAQEITQFVEFRAKDGGSNNGKGIIWTGEGSAKQLVFISKPSKLFCTENLDLDKEKSYGVGGLKVLDQKELGPTVVKSSLQQVGRLKGLIVDGHLNVDQYLFYNGSTNRLGLGTDSPNGALSVAENAVEVMVGTTKELHGMIGTYASTDFDIVTDNTSRIVVKSNGDVSIGNPNRSPVKVSINGKLSIGVATPDPNVDLHVAGPVRINNRLQLVGNGVPTEGTFNAGDIVWNDNPVPGQYIGWVCGRAGSPGSWFPFGVIVQRG